MYHSIVPLSSGAPASCSRWSRPWQAMVAACALPWVLASPATWGAKVGRVARSWLRDTARLEGLCRWFSILAGVLGLGCEANEEATYGRS